MMAHFRRLPRLLIWLGCSLSLAPPLRAATPLPPSPSPHFVRDEAHWLSPNAFQALDQKLETFERDTTSQVVVAIFPKIPDGEELFDFSQRLFEAWKPGQKSKDNGALLLIFSAERQMRIHTGLGMEGVLPDARCKQIISDLIAPQLRKGNREAAINAGVDAMIASAKGEYQGTGKTHREGQNGKGRTSDGLAHYLIPAIFWIIVLLQLRRALRGRSGGVFYSRGNGGGWSSGGGGSGGGSSSGGGGFSGGGGDSGGGGSSGKW